MSFTFAHSLTVDTASILRRLYVRPGTGVGAFRKVYGGKNKQLPGKPHFQLAAGGLVRNLLQALEKAGLVEKNPNGYLLACSLAFSLLTSLLVDAASPTKAAVTWTVLRSRLLVD